MSSHKTLYISWLDEYYLFFNTNSVPFFGIPIKLALLKHLRVKKILRFVAYKKKLLVNNNLSSTISLLSIQASLNLDSLVSRRKSMIFTLCTN